MGSVWLIPKNCLYNVAWLNLPSPETSLWPLWSLFLCCWKLAVVFCPFKFWCNHLERQDAAPFWRVTYPCGSFTFKLQLRDLEQPWGLQLCYTAGHPQQQLMQFPCHSLVWIQTRRYIDNPFHLELPKGKIGDWMEITKMTWVIAWEEEKNVHQYLVWGW